MGPSSLLEGAPQAAIGRSPFVHDVDLIVGGICFVKCVDFTEDHYSNL